MKIVDLAMNMIKLAGLRLGKDINISYTGLRPGEKLYEELLTSEEGANKTTHDKIFVSKLENIDEYTLTNNIDKLLSCNDDLEIIDRIKEIIPTYRPNHRI